MKKGQLVNVQFGTGSRFGLVVSSEACNFALHRYYFVPANKRKKDHEFELEAIINNDVYTFQPQNMISLSDSLPCTPTALANVTVVDEVCKRIRLIMDLG